jgi:glycosyltransferase involved in cell wall biosynthesis
MRTAGKEDRGRGSLPVSLHIVLSANPKSTGICKIISTLALHSPSRYRISVLFFEDGPLREEMHQNGITAAVVPWLGGKKDVAGALRVWNWMRNHPAKITHIHQGGRTVQKLARIAGTAVIILHVHSPIVEPTLSPISDLQLSGYNAVVSSSRAVANALSNIQSQVIYAGIDTGSEPPPPPSGVGPIRMGVLSRLVPLKRVEAVIEAQAQLAEMGIEFQTEICGEGPSEPLLRNLAQRSGVQDKVRFLGWRKDTAALLAQWDLLVMPSIHEGFPIAALEAMAARRAVVASSVGGLPELVYDGSSGVLIPAGDTGALVQTLRKLSLERTAIDRMGIEGWKRANRLFSGDRMAQQFIALYDRLLER